MQLAPDVLYRDIKMNHFVFDFISKPGGELRGRRGAVIKERAMYRVIGFMKRLPPEGGFSFP